MRISDNGQVFGSTSSFAITTRIDRGLVWFGLDGGWYDKIVSTHTL